MVVRGLKPEMAKFDNQKVSSDSVYQVRMFFIRRVKANAERLPLQALVLVSLAESSS
jgi:hypothetical protein